jgi:competence ComEA-like helix-hairpin-helix protein
MDKVALQLYLDGKTTPNPFYMQAWELLNHYNPSGGTWWGHCNGWSAAAILMNEPTGSVNSSADGHSFSYTSADLKGLLTESHYSTYSHFYGSRYNGEDDDITDLSPKAFHKLVNFYIREQRVALVFDTTASEAVWNFPAWKTEATVLETTPAGLADLVNLNMASAEELDTLPEIGEALSQAIVEYRMTFGAFETVDDLTDVRGIGPATLSAVRDLVTADPFQRTFEVEAIVTLTTDGVSETFVDSGDPSSFEKRWKYTLYTDAHGNVTGGEWEKDDDHPDFAWVPYSNPGQRSDGRNENPYLKYSDLLDIIGDDFERQ